MTPEFHPTRETAEQSLSGWTRLSDDKFSHGTTCAHIELLDGCEQACRITFTTGHKGSEALQDAVALAEERAWDRK